MNSQQENSQILRQYQEETKKQTNSEPQGSGFASGKVNFSFDFKFDEQEDAILRQPRSQAFLDAVAMIDLLSSTDEEIIERLRDVVDEDTLEEFIEMTPEELYEEIMLSFKEEMEERERKLESLPELEVKPDKLEGIISQCYIDGCDVHAIDKNGYILEHFRCGSKLPGNLQKGRDLYHKNKGCNCIEVYSNCCRIINWDGSVTTVGN